MKKFIFTGLIVITLALGCKEKKPVEDEPKPTPTGDIEMTRITRHQWVIYKLELGGTDVWNNPFVVKECERDDSYRFYKDSSLMHYENSKVCSGSPDSTAFSWKFYDGRKKMIGTIFGLTDTADVVSIQDSTMEFSLLYQGTPSKFYFKKK